MIDKAVPTVLRNTFRCLALALCGAAIAAAQTQDISGNGQLNGSYRFRHVAVQAVDAKFNPTQVTASYGTITFDGAGHYTITGSTIDNTVSGGAPVALSVSGTYGIGAVGTGYITNPLHSTLAADNIQGGVGSTGVFVGSSTEAGATVTFNDIFIAIPFGSVPTNASFTAAYQAGLLDFASGGSTAIKNALFELTPNGAGAFGAVTLNGQASNQTSTTLTQSIPAGATYNFNSDGSATLNFGLPTGVSSPNALLTGTRTMYVSSDGNFILGWTSTGYDIFFGVKALTSAGSNQTSYGLYFTGALEDAPVAPGVDSYYGSINNTADVNGDGILHQRVSVTSDKGAFDFGTNDLISVSASGASSNTDLLGYNYVFGASGLGFVAIGSTGEYSLVVGLHAQYFSGSGVYLSPTGVVNAASYLPVTAPISPGQMVTLFGTGLAAGPALASGGGTLPTSLGNVSVTMNGIACPEISVYAGQISVIAPYELSSNAGGFINVQVTNNGTKSNVVQVRQSDAVPSAFAATANGIGYAAALHGATFAGISTSSPAVQGEGILLYLTGLGSVTPSVADGTLAPSSPLSIANQFNQGSFQVLFDDYTSGAIGIAGTISYAGLSPGYAGLYQVNVQVPTNPNFHAGDSIYVEFITDHADVDMVQIPLGTAAGNSATSVSSNAKPDFRAKWLREVASRAK